MANDSRRRGKTACQGIGVSAFGPEASTVGAKTRRARGSAALSRIRAGFEARRGRGLSFRCLIKAMRLRGLPPKPNRSYPRLKTGADSQLQQTLSSARRVFRPTNRGPASPNRPIADTPTRRYAHTLCFLPPFTLFEGSDEKGLIHLHRKLLPEPFCRGRLQLPRSPTETSLASLLARVGYPLGRRFFVAVHRGCAIRAPDPCQPHWPRSDPAHREGLRIG
jgi:hypothetical protein